MEFKKSLIKYRRVRYLKTIKSFFLSACSSINSIYFKLLLLLPNGVGIKSKCKNQKPNENEGLKFGGKTSHVF